MNVMTRDVTEYLTKVAIFPVEAALLGALSGAVRNKRRPLRGAFRGAAGAGTGALAGSLAGQGLGHLGGTAAGGLISLLGGASPETVRLVGEASGTIGQLLGGVGGGAYGGYRGFKAMHPDKHEAREERKGKMASTQTLGFTYAFLKAAGLEESGEMEKVAWTGKPRQAKGKIAEELTRIANLVNVYGGGQREGAYTIEEMMGILKNSDRVVMP